MPLFSERRSMLEVQNRALIKTAKQRAERIDELERELQILRERAEQTDRANRELQAFREGVGQANKVERELQTLRETVEHQTDKLRGELQQARSEIERLTLERDFYSKKASALEEENRQLTESATKWSRPEDRRRNRQAANPTRPRPKGRLQLVDCWRCCRPRMRRC
jgi:chromosome segregation ATPase